MPKSFMHNEIFIPALFLFVSTIFIIAGCSKSDDQKEFENQALSVPNNITETDASGELTGTTDPDDWRISPMYRSLINILVPAYPNPVPIGQPFEIDIDLGFEDTVTRIALYVIDPNSSTGIPKFLYEKTDLLIIETLPFNSAQFADEVGVGNSNIYRILIYDGNQNLISYGDVKIE